MKKYQVYDLSNEELLKLFDIAMVGIHSVKHDILSPLGAIANGVEIIEGFFSDKETYDVAKEEFPIVAQTVELLLRSAETVYGRIVNMDRFLPDRLNTFNSDVKYRFVALPGLIARELQELHKNKNGAINIDDSCDDLPLVFPHCTLYSLFYEIVGNAVKHGALRVDISWSIAPGKFCFTVADDGPGLTEALDGEYVGLGLATKHFKRMKSKKDGRGLGFVLNILDRARGTALVRRSRMRGSEILVELPVFGVWHEASLPELKR